MNKDDEYYNNHELRFIINKSGYGRYVDDLEKTIDNAIEYIERNINEQLEDDYLINRTNLAQYNKTLLDILKGSDNND